MSLMMILGFVCFQGYGFRLTATISEWLLAISVMIYLLTYFKEFRCFKMHKPECRVHDKHRRTNSTIEQIGNGLP